MKKVLFVAALVLVSIIYQHAASADYALQGTPGDTQPKVCWQNCQPIVLQAVPSQLQNSVNVLGVK